MALKYHQGTDKAPWVIASGQGLIAEKIIAVAKEQNIPIHQNQPLAQLLQKVEVGQSIPQELYQVVAEVLAMVLKMNLTRKST